MQSMPYKFLDGWCSLHDSQKGRWTTLDFIKTTQILVRDGLFERSFLIGSAIKNFIVRIGNKL